MKVIIIGANAAGMSAASQIKRQEPEWDVMVLEKGSYISYAGCGIPYFVQGLVTDLDKLITVTPDDALHKRGLNLKLHHEVTAIDPVINTVSVETPDGLITENFDRLIIATGANPHQTSIEYKASKRILNAHRLDDAKNIRSLIESKQADKCAVIGGGYIAIEMLEALKKQGLNTHMFHRRNDLSRNFEKEISDIMLAEMDDEGIELHLNQAVTRITGHNSEVELQTEKEKFIFDMAIVATGVEPNSCLAQDSGIEIGVKGAIRVNRFMQTNYDHIYAAGDCAETTNIITGEPQYLALALKANKEGIVAGLNACGGNEEFPGVLGSAITKFFDLGIARTGLTLAEAENCGFEAIKFSITANSRAHYYPGRSDVKIVLIAEKKEGRLLGAQMAGPVDGVKRIDVYATAITAEMNIDQIFELDLAYAPPFSPVYDPVVLSGRVGRKKIGSP
ncbi:MAG: FAD-dependent oxidoreductase [Dethiobacteria bacterium]